MTEMEELQNDLTQISKIYTIAKETFDYCFYLHKPNSELEREYLSKNKHLIFIRHILWRQTVVEIFKLVSGGKNDKFGLSGFLSKLHQEEEVQKKVGSDFFLKCKRRLRTNKNAIKNIGLLRDKIYAHTDRDSGAYKNLDLAFENVQKVFDSIGEIIKDIYEQVFDGHLELRNLNFERDRFDLIKVLAEHHNEKIKNLFGSFVSNT